MFNEKIIEAIRVQHDSYVNLGDKHFSEDEFASLVEALNENPNVTSLNLEYNGLGPENVENILKLNHIKKLYLGFNPIGDESCKIIKSSAKFDFVDFRSNELPDICRQWKLMKKSKEKSMPVFKEPDLTSGSPSGTGSIKKNDTGLVGFFRHNKTARVR